MDCTLAALIACFNWSGLFIDTGVAWQDRGDTFVVSGIEAFERSLPNGVTESGTEMVTREYDVRHNPYGRFSIGYLLDFGSVAIEVAATHRSSLDVGDDRGINSVGISARWFPFR